jgi:hypothetical protein
MKLEPLCAVAESELLQFSCVLNFFFSPIGGRVAREMRLMFE